MKSIEEYMHFAGITMHYRIFEKKKGERKGHYEIGRKKGCASVLLKQNS